MDKSRLSQLNEERQELQHKIDLIDQQIKNELQSQNQNLELFNEELTDFNINDT